MNMSEKMDRLGFYDSADRNQYMETVSEMFEDEPDMLDQVDQADQPANTN